MKRNHPSSMPRRRAALTVLTGVFLLLWCAAVAFSANPRSVTLTIQENGGIRVSEVHDVVPASGGWVQIAPLPETILPASIHASPMERSQTIDILTQQFVYDLADTHALFRTHQGLPIQIKKEQAVFSGKLSTLPDFSAATPSLILTDAAEGAAKPTAANALLIPNLYALDYVKFASARAITREPTLLWQLASAEVPASVLMNYAADGIYWNASHDAILAPDTRSLSLSTRIRLQNMTTREFRQATIRLALTEKGLFAPLIPAADDPRARQPVSLRYGADGRALEPERQAASYSVVANYDMPASLTLPANSDVYAGYAFSASLPVETVYIYDGVRFDRYQRNRRSDAALGSDSSPIVETHITFRNENNISLPPGPLRVLRGNPTVPLEWVGSDWLPPLRPTESITLNLGPAANLSGQRIRTAFTEVEPLKIVEESFEITLYNQTPFERTIRVVEHLYRGDAYTITAAGLDHTPGQQPNTIHFNVPVKAGSSRTFNYTVRYTW